MPSSSRLRRRALAWLGALLTVITIWPQICATMPVNSIQISAATTTTTSTINNNAKIITATTRATSINPMFSITTTSPPTKRPPHSISAASFQLLPDVTQQHLSSIAPTANNASRSNGSGSSNRDLLHEATTAGSNYNGHNGHIESTTLAPDYRKLLLGHSRNTNERQRKSSGLPYARIRLETMRARLNGNRDRLLRRDEFIVEATAASISRSIINNNNTGVVSELSAANTRKSINNVLISSRTVVANNNTTMNNSFFNEPNTSDIITNLNIDINIKQSNNRDTVGPYTTKSKSELDHSNNNSSKISNTNNPIETRSHCSSGDSIHNDECLKDSSSSSTSSKTKHNNVESSPSVGVTDTIITSTTPPPPQHDHHDSVTENYANGYYETSVQKSAVTIASPEKQKNIDQSAGDTPPISHNDTDNMVTITPEGGVALPLTMYRQQQQHPQRDNVTYVNNVLLSRTDRSIRSSVGAAKGSRRRQTNLERIERSANLSHVTGTRNVQLLLKNRLLQLLPDGRVNGTIEDTSDYTILHRTAVDIGQIKIQGVATCLFLCMDSCGNVYGSKEFTHDCIFNESMQDHYNIYSSAHHSTALKTFYLAMNKMGQSRRTHLPANKELGKLATYAKAFPLPVNETRTETLIARLFGANHVKHGLRQLCDGKKSLAPLTRRIKPKPQCPAAAGSPGGGGKSPGGGGGGGKLNKKGKRGGAAAEKGAKKGGKHCPPDGSANSNNNNNNNNNNSNNNNSCGKRRKNQNAKLQKQNGGKNGGNNGTMEMPHGKGGGPYLRGGGKINKNNNNNNNNKGKVRKGKLLRTTTTTERLQTSTVEEMDDEADVTEEITVSSSTEHDDESEESSIAPGRGVASLVDNNFTEEDFDA